MGGHVHEHGQVIVSLLFLFKFILQSSSCSAVTMAAPVNINLKPSGRFLKGLFQRPNDDASASRIKKVSIDWSGRYECQVTGYGGVRTSNWNTTTTENDQNQQPTCDEMPSLLSVDGPPYLQVGFTYDLQSTAGNSFFTKLQWNHVDWQVAIEGPREQEQEQENEEQLVGTRESPPLNSPAVLSTHVLLKPGRKRQQQHTQHDACSLELGTNTLRQAYMLARAPISLLGESTPRLHAEYKALWNDHYANKHPPMLSQSQEHDPDWWIPKLQISTSGQLESSHTFGWRNRGRISLRWSRSLGWFGDVDSSTRVRLEVMQRLSAHHTTTATLHGILEDLPETAHVTLTHQHHVRHQSKGCS
jgi:hypothetical protein